jgi:hypothetical protein
MAYRESTPDRDDEDESCLLGWGTPLSKLIEEAKKMGRSVELRSISSLASFS